MSENDPRIEALEARVAELEATVEALTGAAAREAEHRRLPSLTAPPPPPPTAHPVDMTPVAPPPPAPPRRQIEVDSETVLKWGGVGLVVLAIGFAVSTAIQRGWIGPLLQLAGAILLAIVLIGTGLRLRHTRRPWAHALCSGGVAALFITFASSLFIDQADTDLAYVLTFVVALGAVALARFVPSEWVGVVALLGAVIGWLVIADGDAPFIETGAVFVVGLLVVVVVAVEQRWFALRVLVGATGLIGVMGFAAVADGGNEQIATLAAGGVVAGILLVVPSIGEPEGGWRSLELRLPVALAPWAWIVIIALFFDEDRTPGWVALGVTAAVVLISLVARSRLLHPHFIALLVGASTTLTFGLGILLATEAAWVAVAVQGVGLLVLARALKGGWLVLVNAAALLFVAAVFAAFDGTAAWTDDTDIWADVARLAVIVALGVAVWLVEQSDLRRIGALVVLGLVLVWLGSVLVHLPQGQGAVSLSWAVVGVALIVGGAVRKVPDLGTVGLIVLAITVGKLLIVDMAEVDTLWRAGLFLVVGLALMRLGFLLPRLTGSERDATQEQTPAA